MKKDLLFIILQFLLFACYFIMIETPYFPVSAVWDYLFWALAGIGCLVILLGIINLDENLTVFPSPKNNNALISNGIYKYVRHPIYAGILLMMLSYALLKMSYYLVATTLVLGVVFYFKSKLEEKYLVERHAEYATYKEQVGRFFPRLFT